MKLPFHTRKLGHQRPYCALLGSVILFLLLNLTNDVHAQNIIYVDIIGPTQVCANGVTQYTYTSSHQVTLDWSVSASGEVLQNNGVSITVRWQGAGSISASGSSVHYEENCWFNDTWPNFGWVCENVPVYNNYYSNPFSVTPFAAGSINSPAVACAPASGTLTLVGNAGPVVRWESSTNLINWTTITNTATTLSYSSLSVTTHFRAVTNPSGCQVTSPHATVNVNSPSVGGTLTPSGSLCVVPGSTTSLTLSGHVGNIVRWESNNGSGWQVINSTTNPLLFAIADNSVQLRAWVVSGVCPGAYSTITTLNRNPSGASFTVSTNACYAKTLTRSGTPGTNELWYWQGTDPNGTSTANSGSTFVANTTGTYHLRPRNTVTGCWGSSFSASVSVSDPAPPGDRTHTFCEFDTMVLPTFVTATNQWFNSAGTVMLHQGSAYTVDLLPGTHTFKVKLVGWDGCVSANFSTTTVIVNANGTGGCDQKLNWTESIGYTHDANGTQSVAAASKTFSDGMGKPLQTQSKVLARNNVLASQPVYDQLGNPSLQTLPAPINASDFAYRHKFVANPSGARYGAGDYDLPANLNNPATVNNSVPGTLGWYYSTNNNLEPQTPVTGYPYARSYTPPGPNPLTSSSAGPGEAHRMGTGRETRSERSIVDPSVLNHYFALQSHFYSNGVAPNLTTTRYANNASTISEFTPSNGATVTSFSSAGQTYARVQANSAGVITGVRPIGNSLSVTPGLGYRLRVRGYCSSPAVVSLIVRNVSTINDVVWPGAALPQGAANEAWIETTFTAPAGCSAITVGALWQTSTLNDTFFINDIELVEFGASFMLFRSVSTDPNGRQAASFTDLEGRTLATATLNGSTYDNWSYTYYNDLGQVVATVAPNGVNTSSTALPNFVTRYFYDHLGRLIETTSTDEGTSRFVYSRDGKIRFSENQEQRTATPKRFSYTNYDYLGRLIESGEYISNGTSPFVFEPHTTTTPAPNSVLSIVNNTGFTGVSRKVDATRCTDYTYIDYDFAATDLPAGDPLHAAQTFLTGNISKTENAEAKTWYSYDEFGNVLWTKQNITGLGDKAVDYTYDFLGNVTEVAYQKGQPDAFYHHYTYDADQNLTRVETSVNGTTKTTRAQYFYYLHGPLKRVVLGNNVQGLDYVYTITGALKTINNGEPNRDPGLDGLSGPNATVAKDVFGLSLQYYANDYSGAGYNAGTHNFPGYPDQFGGMVKGMNWHNATDNNLSMNAYAYGYDQLYQLTDSRYGTIQTNNYVADFNQAYRETIPGYDKNGNIQSLQRRTKAGTVIGNYNYIYEPNTNKTDRINHNGSLLVDYTYNAIGQLRQQVEGTSTMNISYTPYGLTKELRNGSNQLVATYHYDDRGDRVKKTTYNNGTATGNTFYVHDAGGNPLAIYTQTLPGGPVVLAEVPLYGGGRLGMYKPAAGAYFYEINDHLGNVRAVVGTPENRIYTATMESEVAATEQPPFGNVNNRRAVMVAANNTPGGNEVARLNNTQPAGPAISLRVSPGDKLDIETWAYYEAGTNYNNAIDGAVMTTAIAAAFGGVSGAAGESGRVFNLINNGIGTFGLGGTSSTTLPAAYMQYMVYDNSDRFLFGGFQRVTAAGNLAKEKITQPQITISEPGYVYIFLYNRSNSANWVYFDDFKITHTGSPVVAGADYYPFGLTMTDREILDEAYRYGYQGQYSEEDKTTGWNEFELRMYDARFGRWTSIDPYGQFSNPYLGMGNQPNLSTDPNGGWSWITAGVGFAIGATAGYVASDGDWGWALAGGIAGGAMGGLSFKQGSGNASRFNGGFREYGGLSIGLNNELFSSLGNGLRGAGKFVAQHPGVVTGAINGYLNSQQAPPLISPPSNEVYYGMIASTSNNCCGGMPGGFAMDLVLQNPTATRVVARTAARTGVGWAAGVAEPTPAGEVVMTVVTLGVVAYEIFDAVQSAQNVHQMKGGKQWGRDRDFGIKDPAFWQWWHRVGKKLYGGKDITTKEQAEEIYQDWIDMGKPSAK
ncbi:MAG TPA: hypothetical protein DCE81_14050 [Cytophagales bacterium]|nr:hypothetical protein [Cytophagales bacterium]